MGEMPPQSDAQLLRAYAERGAEAAFAELVQRHTGLVYSAALRQVESPDIAAEIAQNVFIGLAHGARSLAPRLAAEASLAGWLCRSARNLSLNHRRDESRRLTRERLAMEQLITIPDDPPNWEHLRRVLDDAMAELSEPDYDALALRFYSNQDLRAVGLALGVSEDTAQKRVSRALDKLREHVGRRGISAGAAALSVVISANAVQAAPAGLAATIAAAAALTGTTLATTATATATKALAMTAMQKTLITATVAVLAGAGIYEARQAAQLHDQVQTLQHEQAPLAHQVQQLQQERDETTRQLASLRQENERLNRNTGELLKLRGEVTSLRVQAQEMTQFRSSDTQNSDPMESAAKDLVGKMKLLKQRLQQMPEKNIPELQYLDSEAWARVAQTAKVDTDDGVRQALSSLRQLAKEEFVPEMGKAVQAYAQANEGRLPANVSQLKPYFELPVDDATLARYQMIETGNVREFPEQMIVAEKAAVDDQHDYLFQIGLNVFRSTGVGQNANSVVTTAWSPRTPPARSVVK